jgi:tetratricopeptide (TPR) repeat protein
MDSLRTSWLLLWGLFILCFGLGAGLQPQFQSIESDRRQSNNFFKLLLGDSSRIFANESYVEADVYYHSGYYPTIFDNKQAFETAHMAADTGAVASHNSGEETSFMGPPRDWLDAFGRHFMPNRHTHLDEGGASDDLSGNSKVAEILPWLKLSAKLDPEDVRTYLVMSYWLRNNLNQVSEAEQILREGLRNNPGNPQLLYELGRIYFDNYHQPDRARTIWEAALRTWALEKPGISQSERLKLSNGNFDDRFVFEQILVHLAQLEGSLGNIDAAIADLKQAEPAAPDPSQLQRQIDELRQGKKLMKPPATPEP